jgi:aryl-alcohol dehydrogenase-like predicted oxidoreductase
MMRRVRLGETGPEVAAIGFGAWGLSGDYGPADDAESVAVVRRALDLGVDFIDTADEYGNGHNERLIGNAIRDRRHEVVLATKVGLVRGPAGVVGVCGRPEHVRRAAHASLGRLGVDHVDLLYLHRVDTDVPIEETIGAMAELQQAGQTRFLGLSEVGPELVRRAHAVHPITAVQSEYSLWTRDPETEVLPALAELGIGFVAFSPLGRGFLAGAVAEASDLAERDFRRSLPRFRPENLERNLRLVEPLRVLAAEKEAAPGQIALAWLVRQGVVPIPGTRSVAHLESNVEALEIELSAADLARVEEIFAPDAVVGERYPSPGALSAERAASA